MKSLRDFCNKTHVLSFYKYVRYMEREGRDGQGVVYEYRCEDCGERRLYTPSNLQEMLREFKQRRKRC